MMKSRPVRLMYAYFAVLLMFIAVAGGFVASAEEVETGVEPEEVGSETVDELTLGTIDSDSIVYNAENSTISWTASSIANPDSEKYSLWIEVATTFTVNDSTTDPEVWYAAQDAHSINADFVLTALANYDEGTTVNASITVTEVLTNTGDDPREKTVTIVKRGDSVSKALSLTGTGGVELAGDDEAEGAETTPTAETLSNVENIDYDPETNMLTWDAVTGTYTGYTIGYLVSVIPSEDASSMTMNFPILDENETEETRTAYLSESECDISDFLAQYNTDDTVSFNVKIYTVAIPDETGTDIVSTNYSYLTENTTDNGTTAADYTLAPVIELTFDSSTKTLNWTAPTISKDLAKKVESTFSYTVKISAVSADVTKNVADNEFTDITTNSYSLSTWFTENKFVSYEDVKFTASVTVNYTAKSGVTLTSTDSEAVTKADCTISKTATKLSTPELYAYSNGFTEKPYWKNDSYAKLAGYYEVYDASGSTKKDTITLSFSDFPYMFDSYDMDKILYYYCSGHGIESDTTIQAKFFLKFTSDLEALADSDYQEIDVSYRYTARSTLKGTSSEKWSGANLSFTADVNADVIDYYLVLHGVSQSDSSKIVNSVSYGTMKKGGTYNFKSTMLSVAEKYKDYNFTATIYLRTKDLSRYWVVNDYSKLVYPETLTYTKISALSGTVPTESSDSSDSSSSSSSSDSSSSTASTSTSGTGTSTKSTTATTGTTKATSITGTSSTSSSTSSSTTSDKYTDDGTTITMSPTSKTGTDVWKEAIEKKLPVKITSNKITWTFESVTEAIDMDPSITLGQPSDEEKAAFDDTEVPGGMNYTFMTFAHDGTIPGVASIEVDLTNHGGFVADDTIYLYYYNATDKKFEFINSNSLTSENHCTFKISHCSEYLVTNKALDSETEKSSSDDTSTASPKTGEHDEISFLNFVKWFFDIDQ